MSDEDVKQFEDINEFKCAVHPLHNIRQRQKMFYHMTSRLGVK